VDGIIDFLHNSSREWFFYIAIAGSAIFVLQMAMTFIGVGGDNFDTDVSTDFDSSDIDMTGGGDLSLVSFFSLRAIIGFLTFFGWAGFFWGNTVGGFILSVGCGMLMAVLTTLVVWFFVKMQQSGNLSQEDFIGKAGTVYLSIPGGDDSGLVTVQFPNCTRQIKAIAADEIAAGKPVKVMEVIGNDLFRVEKFSK